MKGQKFVELELDRGRALTEAAVDGYRFGGTVATVADKPVLVWLDPADRGSLFRICYVRPNRTSELRPRLQRLAELKGPQGFRLVTTLAAPGRKKGTYAIFERLGSSIAPLRLDEDLVRQKRAASDPVPCPVIGCPFTAPRMTQAGVNLDKPKPMPSGYLCPDHRIYVSPSTFEYEDPGMSLLWPEDAAVAVKQWVLAGRGGKRTWDRMGRERDEDSLTWNVFRYLERQRLLDQLLKTCGTHTSGAVKPVYWSVDEGAVWQPLVAARHALGENEDRGSEPDVILVSDTSVVILEVKFTAASVTTKATVPAYYEDYALGHAPGLFTSGVGAAVKEIGYELTRFFLLAHALRAATGKLTHVVSLTRDQQDRDLGKRVGRAVANPNSFSHISWSDVQKVVLSQRGMDAAILARYLKGKTAGYEGEKLVTLL